ncbi:type II toxin-antitoxin system toxin [Draconibacterium sp.]|jgi:uncharacterized protein YutE (UPF0331/DUF86 family)
MDEILINKKTSIERCIRRIRDDYQDDFATNYTKQDAVILNIERACQSAIDMGNRVVKLKNLGLPQSNRDTFLKLEKEGILPADLSKTMQAMAGFRNIAVHDYSSVNIEVIQNIVLNHLQDLIDFSKLMIDQV